MIFWLMLIARNNDVFLRNDVSGVGKYQIPKIEKQLIDVDELAALNLIGYNNAKYDDLLAANSGLHFFIDDYKMAGFVRNPDKTFERISQYQFALTPDYSIYKEMPFYRQLQSVADSRWVGAWWQRQGMIVFPTISWSDSQSYQMTMDTVEKGSIVAVSTIGVKKAFVDYMRGYDEMLRRIEPVAIICLGDPFPEMKGNIIVNKYLFGNKEVA
jgi:hypothetical protein